MLVDSLGFAANERGFRGKVELVGSWDDLFPKDMILIRLLMDAREERGGFWSWCQRLLDLC